MGLLNNRMKSTGEVSAAAVEVMTPLNRDASKAALGAGARAATDVTGFGLLGHLYKMGRASGVGMILDRAAVPGTRRNLEWVRHAVQAGPGIDEDDLLLLADAQTSGGLLVIGEVPGYPVIGETVAGAGIQVR